MKLNEFPPQQDRDIFAKWQTSNGTTESYIMEYSTTGNLRWVVQWQGGGPGNRTDLLVNITSSISAGEWHYYTVMHEKGVASRIYLDGNIVTSSTFPDANVQETSLRDFGIGYSEFDAIPSRKDPSLDGNIDEFAIFNTALSSSDIATYSSSGVPTNADHLSGLFNFNEGTGVTASNSADNPEGPGSGSISGSDMNWSGGAPSLQTTSSYTTESINVYKTTGNDLFLAPIVTLETFSDNVITGNVRHQLSKDGILWKTWNTGSSTWTSASFNERSTETQVNDNITNFSMSYGDKIFVQSFLESDGTQAVELDTITIGYSIITGSESGAYAKNMRVAHLN